MKFKAIDIARKKLVWVKDTDKVSKVADTIVNDTDIGSVLVKDKAGKAIGVVTDDALLRLVSQEKDVKDLRAKDVMTVICTVKFDAPIGEVISEFDRGKCDRVAVIKDKKIVGIIKKKIAERFLPLYDRASKLLKMH